MAEEGTQVTENNQPMTPPVAGEGNNNPTPPTDGDQSKEGTAAEPNNQKSYSGFVAGLPEAYRDSPLLEGVTKSGELFERYRDLNESGRVIPGEGATDEEWSAFRKTMGVPETTDGYDLPAPEEMDANAAEGMSTWLKNTALEVGIPAPAVRQFWDKWISDIKNVQDENHKAEVAGTQKRMADLKATLGDDADSKIASSEKLAQEVFKDKGFALLKERGLLSDPDIVNGLLSLQKSLGEDSLPKNATVGGVSKDRSSIDRAKELFGNTTYPKGA